MAGGALLLVAGEEDSSRIEGNRPTLWLVHGRRLYPVLLYLAGAVLCVLIAWTVLKLDDADLTIPLNLPGDGVYYALQIKTLIETGWVHHNPLLSAPFELDLYDFAHFDNLHLAIMKVFTLFTSNWAVVLNLYYLVTYPLTTVTALVLLRRLGLPAWLSLACSLLYAFTPYHLWRGEGHIMLASYYLVPLSILTCLWLAEKQALNGMRATSEPGRLRGSPRFWAAVLICLAAASAGHYYAVFACFFFLVAGAHSSIRFRQWRNLAHGFVLCGVTLIGLVANLLPNTLYWRAEGANRLVSLKAAEDAEVYGLKIVQMVLPVPDHRLGSLAELTRRYVETAPIVNENMSAALGAVAAIGFLVLVAMVFRPRSRTQPCSPLETLSVLNLAAILVATVGGFGTVFSYVVNPQVHGYNRMSIYIALFGLACVARLIDAAVANISRPRIRQCIAGGASVLLLAFGLFDQAVRPGAGLYERNKKEFQQHAAFGAQIQKAMPEGAMIFQWPVSSFPFDDGQMGYHHFHVYLHTHGLRFSAPAMANRRAAAWQQGLVSRSPEDFLDALACAGFDGLLIDLRLNRPEDQDLFRRTGESTGGQLLDDGGTRHFFDLRGFRQKLKSRYSSEEWQSKVAKTVPSIWVKWGREFRPLETATTDPHWRAWRWCAAPCGEMTVNNESNEAVPMNLRLTVYPFEKSGGYLTIRSSFLAEALPLNGGGESLCRKVTVPPGRHRLQFQCTDIPPRQRLCFRIESFSLEPADESGITPYAFLRR
jgi:phosphoglycerol transferase